MYSNITGKKLFLTILLYSAIVMVLLFLLLPVFWIVMTSIKPEKEWLHSPPIWISRTPTLQNFKFVFINNLKAIQNSFITVLISVAVALPLGTMASYSVSRFKTGGKNFPIMILSANFLPPIIFTVPLLILYKTLGMIDTRRGLILIYIAFNLPLVIWMMKGFFDEIPKEIDEMSMIDGCTWWGSLFRIDLRLVAPGLIASALLMVMLCWSEYMFALVLTQRKAITIPVRISTYWTHTVQVYWGYQAALSVIGIVPLVIIILVLQRYLVRGLTFGAIK